MNAKQCINAEYMGISLYHMNLVFFLLSTQPLRSTFLIPRFTSCFKIFQISSSILTFHVSIELAKLETMSRAAVELDFFGLEKANATASKSQFQQFLHRQRSSQGIQGSISKIDPQLLKTVIESGSANAPKGDQILLPALPVYNPAPRHAVSEISADSAPLTIFYNGVVTVYDVPRDMAESILKLAVEGGGKAVESADPKVATPSTDQKQLLQSLNSGDLPIFRKRSLQRFLEKRRERLTPVSPYASPL